MTHRGPFQPLPFCELLCYGSFHRLQAFRNGLLQLGFPVGSLALPGANCSTTGLLWAHSLLRVHPPTLAWGPPPTAEWISALPWTSVDCRGTTCITMAFYMGCREICSSTCSTYSTSFIDLGVCRVVSLPYFHSSIMTVMLSCNGFYTFLSILSLLLTGSALVSDRSILEPAGTGCMVQGGSFSYLLTEANPAALSLPKLCHVNTIQL